MAREDREPFATFRQELVTAGHDDVIYTSIIFHFRPLSMLSVIPSKVAGALHSLNGMRLNSYRSDKSCFGAIHICHRYLPLAGF